MEENVTEEGRNLVGHSIYSIEMSDGLSFQDQRMCGPEIKFGTFLWSLPYWRSWAPADVDKDMRSQKNPSREVTSQPVQVTRDGNEIL